MTPQNYGYVVRWLSESTTVRSRTEAGFPTQRTADLALEEVLTHLEGRDGVLVIERFVATFAWDGVTVRDLCEDE